MKKITILFICAVTLLLLIRCEEEEKLVTYPESYPVFEQAQVTETNITYGDSISLAVKLSDDGTPLSTLEIQIVVNNEVIDLGYHSHKRK